MILQGGGLPAGGQVTAQLTAPGGGVTRQSVRVGENGRFRLELSLAAAGSYQLVVRGQGFEETRTLEVQAPASPNAPASRQVPQEAAPPSPAENEATPDETVPDETVPDETTRNTPNTPATDQNLTAPPTAAVLTPEVVRIANGLEARRAGEQLWKLTFPEGSGTTTEPLLTQDQLQDQLYIGHGSSVLRLEPQTGRVRERFILSGPVERIERVDERTVAITVQHAEGLSERFTLRGSAVQEPVRFGLEPRTFDLLRAEAQVPDPAARLARDPTNPWLYLALGLRQNDPETARATFAKAVGTATTFYDLAGLATVLEENGERALAADAFDAAMRDFAARDYDPRLLRSARLEEAYNFPLTPLKAALERDDDLSAGFWAERLYLAAPNVPGAGDALRAYAALLRVVAPPDAAAHWERRAEESTSAGPNALDRVATALARNGWALALALFVTFLALHLTLLAKYARARRSDRGRGGRAPWLFAVRYTTLSEKFVLLLLLAAALACAALASWYGGSRTPPEVVNSGTLANRAAHVYLAQFQEGASGPSTALIRAYAAQVAGGEAEAQTLLESAGNYAPALNNLGVLSGNTELVARALALQPGLAAARYNTATGNSERTAALPFQARYLLGRPALATPAARDFQAATSGSWQTALARAFTSPQLSFQSAPPFSLNPWLWRAAQLLFLLIVLIHVVFLFVPRPRSAADAPRPWFYELLALLVPGSGLADEAWGIFLLVPWAVFGLGTLAHPFSWPVDLGLSPIGLYLGLGSLYLLNTAAVIVEFLSHRSRRRALELHRSDAPRA